MTMDDSIFELVVRSFSGGLNSDEAERLQKWINEDISNHAEYNDYQEIWKRSGSLKMASQIDVSGSLSKTKKLIDIHNWKRRLIPVLVQIAAIFILAFLLSVVYYNFFVSKSVVKPESLVFQQVRAAFGTQTQLELPDGTIVFLNSGSTLRFPYSFNGMETRNVELVGEGYFSVKKNSEQPFVVTTNKFQVRVLGTTFNVNAYPNNPTNTIALVEGSIQLSRRGEIEIADSLKMKENQVCVYNQSNGNFNIRDEKHLAPYLAWTEGKIVFFNDNVITVIEKLENWYNVEIEIGDKRIEKYRFTGTFINEPLEQVLNFLSLTSRMQYKMFPAKKLENNTYSKRKIILISK